MTSLDIDKVNLDSYVHHNVNITGFRLIDPESWPVQQYLKKFPNSGTGRSNIITMEEWEQRLEITSYLVDQKNE